MFRRREAFIKCTLLRHQLTLLTLTDARNSTLGCNFHLLFSMEGDKGTRGTLCLSHSHTLFAFDETLSHIHLNPFTMKSFSIIPALPSQELHLSVELLYTSSESLTDWLTHSNSQNPEYVSTLHSTITLISSPQLIKVGFYMPL